MPSVWFALVSLVVLMPVVALFPFTLLLVGEFTFLPLLRRYEPHKYVFILYCVENTCFCHIVVICLRGNMPRLNKYTIVEELPKGALTVSQFAKNRGVDHSLIYHELKRKTAKFSIVVFHGINFIVPLT